MPALLRVGGYRFFFYSLEDREPPHIHVAHAGRYAKFWLNPVALASNRGFRDHELTVIRQLEPFSPSCSAQPCQFVPNVRQTIAVAATPK